MNPLIGHRSKAVAFDLRDHGTFLRVVPDFIRNGGQMFTLWEAMADGPLTEKQFWFVVEGMLAALWLENPA